MPIRVRGTLAAMIALAFVAAVLAFMAGPVRAGEPCPSIDATQATIAAIIAKNGGTTEMLNPEESRLYIAALNKEPPQTHLAGDRLLYLASPGGTVILGIVVGTQVCIAGKVSAGLHERLLKGAREHGA